MWRENKIKKKGQAQFWEPPFGKKAHNKTPRIFLEEKPPMEGGQKPTFWCKGMEKGKTPGDPDETGGEPGQCGRKRNPRRNPGKRDTGNYLDTPQD
ncbi:hypothetical protein JTB14_017517 [Gonioctena quinquepunctata]|nr:hypothetical protein JTB14_017517 [Gonioctena quinquepunctata]